MDKIKIAAVSYLNTKPLLYGLKKSNLMNKIELTEDYPAKIAKQLTNNEIDIALVPVAIIPQLNEYHLISNHCIGAVNEVASVSLFSEVDLKEIDTIILDYQSRTSVALTKVLCKHYWKINPVFIDANENYISEIKGSKAAVIIGDRALQHKNDFVYNYDLAEAWIKFTGLPFVFATWISNKPIEENFIKEFDAMQQVGLQNIDAVVAENAIDYYDLKKYYTHNISYNFDEEKKKGLQLFLELLKSV